eukprot:m.59979 g.59979  ORF g.59979 m.59979 type:complete len:66 (+) comp34909_c0_seq27:802-999(+)
MITSVNAAFDEFNLEHFYKDMDFHLSIAWWLGNILPNITPEIRQSLEVKTRNKNRHFYEFSGLFW